MKKNRILKLFTIILGVIMCFSFGKSQAVNIISNIRGEMLNRDNLETLTSSEISTFATTLSRDVELKLSKQDITDKYNDNNKASIRENGDFYQWDIGQGTPDENGYRKTISGYNVWKIISSDGSFENLYYCLQADIGMGNQGENNTITSDKYNVSYDMLTEYTDIKSLISSLKISNQEIYNKIVWILDNSYIPTGDNNYQTTSEYKNLMEKAGISIDVNESGFNLTENDIEVVQQLAIWYFSNPDDIKYHAINDELPDLYLNGEQLSSKHLYTTEGGATITGGKRQEKAAQLYNYYITNAKSNYQKAEPTIRISNTDATVIESDNYYIAGPFKLTKTDVSIKNITVKLNNTEITDYLLTTSDSSNTNITNYNKLDNFYLKINKNKIDNTSKISIDINGEYSTRVLTFMTNSNEATTTQPVVLIEKQTKDISINTNVNINLTNIDIELQKVDKEDAVITSSEATFEIKGEQELNEKTTQGILELNSKKITSNTFEFTYTIKEKVAPIGYNGISEELSVKIAGTTKLENGSYIIENINITDKDGKELDAKKISAEYNSELNKVIIKVINTKIENNYSVKLLKVGEDEVTSIEGAWFKVDNGQAILVSKDGSEIATGTLNNENELELTYKLEETIAPTGYIKIDGQKEVKITAKVELKDNRYELTEVKLKEEVEGITISEEDNVITIKVKNNPIPKKLDLALRKFITKVNDVEYSREPVVDTSTIPTTATYKHTKQPIAVQKGDIITYTIRVYNEGEVDGYAEIITDHLPDHLLPITVGTEGIDQEKYAEEVEFNTKWGWINSEDGKSVSTVKTSNENSETYSEMEGFENVTDTKLNAYVEGSSALDYIDVQIKCLVTDDAVTGEYLTNIAEITKMCDAEGVEVETDRDSTKANVDITNIANYKNEEAINSNEESYIVGQEDDDDFENVVVKEFDLALRKFIKTNNIITAAQDAMEKYKVSAEEEEVQIGLLALKLGNNEINKEGLLKEFGNKIEFLSEVEPFKFKIINGVGTIYTVDSKGKLTVNTDNVIIKEHNREPIVDASKLGTLDEKGNVITNALYRHSKEPVIVTTGEIITYTIRIYNEGTLAGFANEITDNIPEGLEFLPDSSVNVSYRWKMLDAEGNETTEVSKAVMIVTDYLSDKDKNNIINPVSEIAGVKTLSYKDIEVQFKVVAKAENLKDNIIINEAQISADSDRDIDSVPSRSEKYDYATGNNEDDIDYEPIKLQYFDLALRKFVTKVNNTEYNNRYPEIKYNEDGSITYNHTKDPVLVTTGDIVEYTIRVYNEGEKVGYATEIIDNLPDGLEYLPEHETNKQYNWKMLDEAGNITEELSKSTKFSTDYLKEEAIEALVDSEGSKVLSYKDVKIAFKVVEPNTSDKILVNIAQISNDSDDDIDSVPNNNIETEDDLDKEYLKVQYFDLSLKKWVTASKVIYNGKTTTTKTGFTEDSKEIAKVDLVADKMNKTTVKFVYNIKVTNEGELPGYAYEIKDYIPKGLKFVQEDNKDWKELEDGSVVTYKFKDTLLNPGESATVEIVLTWKNSTTNLGLKTNYAEISEDSADDIDSTPDNYNKKEDDIDDAQVILSIKTAGAPTYIGLIFISVAILAGGVFFIKKYVID